MPHRILLTAALRAIEAQHAAARPPLMERAGAAAAAVAQQMLAGATAPPLLLAGPGDNGGDAFVVARLLRAAGMAPQLLFAGDAQRLSPDAGRAHAAWLAAGGECSSVFPDHPCGLIIDGLFGIGLSRAPTGIYAEWISLGNAAAAPVLALDAPSGLDAMSGAMRGEALRADRTITFIALKPGLLTGDGPDLCGDVCVDDLDLALNEGDGLRITPQLFRQQLQPRRRNSHKGDFGAVAVIGGAPGMRGAALLAGRAALHLGAGKVFVACVDAGLDVDLQQPELMLCDTATALAAASVLAIGPGLGRSPAAAQLLQDALGGDLPLVIDADGLNLVAADAKLQAMVAARAAPTLLTPHPGEAARLLGATTAQVQADRLAAALRLAAQFPACHILLKGCGAIVVAAGGDWFINSSGNPGLASAGSGDVLSGMAAALLAQHWPPHDALLAATHLHGVAADDLVSSGVGPVGLAAGELLAAARGRLNAWIEDFDH